MPHRPEGQATSALSPGGVYTPPRVAGSAAASIMRQQTSDSMNTVSQKTTGYGAHSSGVVTPVIKNKASLPWLTAGNKSSDSTDRSTVTTDDSRSIATLATEDEREATASALLMVAKAAEREHQQHYLKGMVVDSGRNTVGENSSGLQMVSSSASAGSASTVPLKKRKKQMDILRRQQHRPEVVDKDACHVSPVSHDSGSTTAVSNRTQSYDSKDLGSSSHSSGKGQATQELLDSAKVHSPAQIGAGSSLPVAQVLISHFPTVLHQVLADKELTNVIRWQTDGEAWKVENWNAMRRTVLPKYFSELRDENGNPCGTIDAFLHNIDAWGFEEIKTGPSAGAYSHSLFIRGAQKLCVKMRVNSRMTQDDDKNSKKPKTVSPGRTAAGETEKMMLQVPMLATAHSNNQSSLPPNKRPRYDNNTMGLSGHGALHWPYSNEAGAGVIWGPGAQFNPHNDMAGVRAFGMRAAMTMNGGNPYVSQAAGSFQMDPRMQLMRGPTPESMAMSRQPFQYNPPQVRSGRGALRGVASVTQQNRASMAPSPSTFNSFRHGFPVSNRGKASRKSAACRTALATEVKQESDKTPSTVTTTSASDNKAGGIDLSEAQRIGSAIKGSVAVAVSRKTLRKLPLTAGAKTVAAGSATTETTPV